MDPGRASTSSTASSGQRDGSAGSVAGSAATAALAAAGTPEFPAGLRVLLVEDDRVCLTVIAKMLRKCLYHVTTCTRAEAALAMLRERKGWFDLVLSDVYMPDMDGFKLLECIGLEMDLPVIMMSSEERQDAVMKGVVHGACDYLIKPVRMEPLKNIWQHVVRRRRHEWKESEQHSGSVEDSDQKQKRAMDEGDNASSRCEGSWKSAKRRKDEEDEEEVEDRDDPSQQKKPRVVWSVDLHGQFVSAVNQLGVEKAVPKKILELMNVPGLTRENVASHLQKFRLYLRRLSNPQHQGRQDSTFTNAQEAEVLSAVDRFNFQTISASNQHFAQSLAALQSGQRVLNTSINMPATDQIGINAQDALASTVRPGLLQQVNIRPTNYLTGGTNNLSLRQFGPSQSVVQSYRNMPLQLGEGTSGFFSMSSSQIISSSFPGGTIGGQLNKSAIMPMTQQGNQLYLSHEERNMHMNLSRQLQSRGKVINGTAGHESIFPLTSSQQIPSNNLSSHLSGVSGTNARVPTTVAGNYANSYSYNAAPYADVQNATNTTGSFESSYQLIGNISGTPSTKNSQTFGTTSFKEVNDYASTFFNELSEDPNQDWKWENANLPYQSDHLNSKQTSPNIGALHVGHKDSIVTIKDGWQDILTARTNTEHPRNNIEVLGESVKVKPDGSSNIFFDKDATSNELMNMVGKKQEGGGVGQLDSTEFNLDGYSLDDIPV